MKGPLWHNVLLVVACIFVIIGGLYLAVALLDQGANYRLYHPREILPRPGKAS